MRLPAYLPPILLALTGCGHVFQARLDPEAANLSSATLVVIGIIEGQQFESPLRFRASIPDPGWKILRRTVRVEEVLFGSESRTSLDVYEVFSTGGASGDWNATQQGLRAVFPLRKDLGYHRLVRDWWRSIYPVTTGPHHQLPLAGTAPLWERIALMNWWIPADRNAKITYPYFSYSDPAHTLSGWRIVKLLRGLIRHPSAIVRIAACRELLSGGWGQDECWETLPPQDRVQLSNGGAFCCTESQVLASRERHGQRSAAWWWANYMDREDRRLLTAINNPPVRQELCLRFETEYPGDTDTGCPPLRPPPATIVTEDGEIPLVGPWP